MVSVKQILWSRLVLTGLGAVLLALLIWFFGPLLRPLEPWPIRAALAALTLLVWICAAWLIHRRRGRTESELTKGLVPDAATAPDPGAEESEAVAAKFAAALAALKRARGSRGYLYEQPWYVIIGPPGSGKTTVLMNSGLRFPLAADLGLLDTQGAIMGAGGTRHCEWWFTDQAVLIDTAGRYTTQDSDAQLDRTGWESFLETLRRTRSRQPLNGVIVAISVGELLASPAERVSHARTVRTRINEISAKLAVRMPIYVVLTKMDLVAGFAEFFDDLDAERREQVWGTTLALQEGLPAAEVKGELETLVARLNDRLLDRLQAERSAERRALIAGFPAQVASLIQPVIEFLEAAVGQTRFDKPSLFRGLYFTSGTQQGTPIDRLTGTLASAFGIDQRRIPSLRAEHGRSYFLTRLLRQVIFGEAMLVSEPPGMARRRQWIRAGAFATVLILCLGAGMAIWLQARAAKADTDQFASALASYEAQAARFGGDRIVDADLPRLAPVLDQARQLPFADASGFSFVPGLSQRGELAAASHGVYRHALERAFFPRLIWRLESEMRANMNRPDFLYEATRVYLMLGGKATLNAAAIRDWMVSDWAISYPGVTQAPLRESLSRHLDALLANPLPDIALDGALVADARRGFANISMGQRVYSRIRGSEEAHALPPWTPADALGATGGRYFFRPSRKPLTEGIPGFLTVAGFYDVLAPKLGPTARDVLSESWIAGGSSVPGAGSDTSTIERDVMALYVADYIRAWDTLLADLAIVAPRNMQEGVEELYVLGSPQSPIRDMLVAVAKQLTLSTPPPAAAGAASAPAKAPSPADVMKSPEQPAPPTQTLEDKYRALRDSVGKGPGAPIDLVLNLVNDLQKQLSNPAGAPSASAPTAVSDPARLLRAEAMRQPLPLSLWLQTLATSADALRGGDAKQQARTAFNAPNGPAAICKQAVEGHYPFRADAPRETPPEDFARLFAPGGLLDAFFTQHLRAYVDQSPAGWKLQPVGGVEPPISEADLVQFQRAAAIRDVFFGAGGATPSVTFEITPISSDLVARRVLLDLNGVAVDYTHGPSRSTRVTWPGAQGMRSVRLTFEPPPSSGPPVIQGTGYWALFRVFGQGTLSQQGGAEEYLLTFHLGDREASFQIQAGSVNNPFGPSLLQAFSCPQLREGS